MTTPNPFTQVLNPGTPANSEPQKEPVPSVDLTILKSELDGKVSSLSEKFDQLQTQIQEVLLQKLAATAEPPKPEPAVEDPELWWDNFKTKPTHVIKETTAPLVNEMKTQVKNEIKAEMTATGEAARYDAMAVQQFPQLKDTSHILFKEYQSVMAEKRRRNPQWDSQPEAVYDSAKIAFANLVSRGEIIPEAFVDEAKRMVSVGDAMMPSYAGAHTANRPDQLTKSQNVWAQRLGVKPENYSKQLRQQ